MADLQLPGTRDVAFVRNPLARARVRGVRKSTGREPVKVFGMEL